MGEKRVLGLFFLAALVGIPVQAEISLCRSALDSIQAACTNLPSLDQKALVDQAAAQLASADCVSTGTPEDRLLSEVVIQQKAQGDPHTTTESGRFFKFTQRLSHQFRALKKPQDLQVLGAEIEKGTETFQDSRFQNLVRKAIALLHRDPSALEDFSELDRVPLLFPVAFMPLENICKYTQASHADYLRNPRAVVGQIYLALAITQPKPAVHDFEDRLKEVSPYTPATVDLV